MLCREVESGGEGAGGDLFPLPALKGTDRQKNGGGGKQCNGKIGHDHRQVRGDRGINGEETQNSESNGGTKKAGGGKGQTEQEESVEEKHGDAGATLRGMEIVVVVAVFFGEVAFIHLVCEGAQFAEMV